MIKLNSDETLETLLKANATITKGKLILERLTHELDTNNGKIEKLSIDLATLTATVRGLEDVVENERKLNRDRQVDTSKLLDDKINNIYKMVSVIATSISIVISLIHNFFK